MTALVDVEQMCVAFAKTKVTATVSTKAKPPRYARVWRTGGGAVNRILDRAQVTITCGANDTGTENGATIASRDATDLRNAFLNEYTQMPLVRGVEEVTGPYFDPDPDTGGARYTFTVILSVRAKR